MPYHLPPIRPLWSFLAAAGLAHVRPKGQGALAPNVPAQGWRTVPGGRVRLHRPIGGQGRNKA